MAEIEALEDESFSNFSTEKTLEVNEKYRFLVKLSANLKAFYKGVF